jgi:type II secretory pathway component PulF
MNPSSRLSTLLMLEDQARGLYLWGMLLDTDVSILDALQAVKDNSVFMKQSWQSIHDEVRAGAEFPQALEGHEHNFCDFVPILLERGSDTGDMHIAAKAAGLLVAKNARMHNCLPTQNTGTLSLMNFFSVLGLLVQQEVAMEDAMTKLAPIGYLSKDKLEKVVGGLKLGVSIAENLKAVGVHYLYCSYIDIGEEVGEVAEACQNIANLIEHETLQHPVDQFPVRQYGSDKILDTAYCEMFAQIVTASIPPMRSMQIMAMTAVHPQKQMFEDMADQIEGGEAFSKVLANFPQFFPKYGVLLMQEAEKLVEKYGSTIKPYGDALQQIATIMKWQYLGVVPQE